MKVWAKKRRENGAVLASPAPMVEGDPLLELIVIEITEEGNRRPIRVARLKAIGEQRILVQLKLPNLVHLKGWSLVLSGIEELRAANGQISAVAQTWVCELRPPVDAIGFSAKDLYRSGVRLPRSSLHQSSGSRGHLLIGSDFSPALQRHTNHAQLIYYESAGGRAGCLIDAQLEFMSETSFGLGGMRVCESYGERPQRIERAGWLCEFDIRQPELTKREARMLR